VGDGLNPQLVDHDLDDRRLSQGLSCLGILYIATRQSGWAGAGIGVVALVEQTRLCWHLASVGERSANRAGAVGA